MIKNTVAFLAAKCTIGRTVEKVGEVGQKVGETASAFFHRLDYLRDSRNSAYSKSSGVVILMFSGLPKIRLTSQP